MLPYLGMVMQSRGRDAWGCSDGQTVLRYTGELIDTWDKSFQTTKDWSQGIFHTRGASCGEKGKVENAHPFSYQKEDGSWIIGIHNGCLHNHDALNRKYSRSCEVDSMHIWMHLAEGKPWSDIEGWGNLAWWETTPKFGQVLHLTRFNSNNLDVAQLEQGEWVFASEMAPIRTIAKLFGNPVKAFYTLDEQHPYWFAPNDTGAITMWRGEQRFPFGPRFSQLVAIPYQGEYGYCGRGPVRPSLKNDLDSYCLKCGNTKVSSKTHVLCIGCFNDLVSQFNATKKALVGVN